MAYCGQFGCSCCSRECIKCNNIKWTHHLSDGICQECLQEEEIEKLKAKIEKQRAIITRLCLFIKGKLSK